MDSSALAQDLLNIARRPAKVDLTHAAAAGEGAPQRPSLRGNLTRTPRDEEIAAVAQTVARDHKGFTSAATEPIPQERFHCFLPQVTARDIAVRAANARVTRTYLLLKALADAGYDVPPEAIVPDKRSRR
ncbi:hypothetical protein [Asticcacaulis sp. W401b]|uniref:hypothetical protein n=1 Tax=Asticcacaulis sp. W401b TaxID=3388666 RepID=UPI003970B4B7